MAKKMAVLSLALLLSGVPAYLIAAQDDHSHHHHHYPATGSEVSTEDPLIDEMMKLDEVFHEIVSGVALGDGQRVHAALETMHGTMEKTHEGVDAGTVKLKKNAKRLKEFVKMDKDFHRNLEKLAHASHSNDHKKMVLLTKKVLDGCVSCHQMFRP